MLSHNNSNLAHEAIVFSEEEARQFIFASPILLASLTDAMKVGSHYTHLGVAHKSLKQHEFAIQAFSVAIKAVAQISDKLTLARAYTNRAMAYLDDENSLFGFSQAILDLEAAFDTQRLAATQLQRMVRKFINNAFHPTCQYMLTARGAPFRNDIQAAIIQLSAKYLAQNNSTRVELCNFYLTLSIKSPDWTLPEPYLLELLLKEASAKKLSQDACQEIKSSMMDKSFVTREILAATDALADAHGYAAAQLLTTRGLGYMRFALFTDALEDFNAANELIDDTNHYAKSIAVFNRGLAYFYDRQNDKAFADFCDAIRLSQSFPMEPRHAKYISCVYIARALWYLVQNNFAAACADIVTAQEAHSSSIYLNEAMEELFAEFPVEFIVYSLTPECHAALRNFVLLLLNRFASAIDLKDEKMRPRQEILNFYLQASVEVQTANWKDFEILITTALAKHIKVDAFKIIRQSVDAATLRLNKFNESLTPTLIYNDSTRRYIDRRCDIIKQNAAKVIADYSIIISQSAFPGDKAPALAVRGSAYKELGNYAMAINDFQTILTFLTAEDKKYQRSLTYEYLFEVYILMDNFPKAAENLIASCRADDTFSGHRFELFKQLLEKYFVNTVELVLPPDCPRHLRKMAKSALKILAVDPTHAELGKFYLDLAKNNLVNFTDTMSTKDQVVHLAVNQGLSAAALECIQNLDKSVLAAKQRRRLDYFKKTKVRHFKFFQDLPRPVSYDRPSSPVPRLSI